VCVCVCVVLQFAINKTDKKQLNVVLYYNHLGCMFVFWVCKVPFVR